MNKLDLFKGWLSYDIERKDSNGSHGYTIDGIYAHGVTTVLNILPKTPLLNWVAKITTEEVKRLWIPNTLFTDEIINESLKQCKDSWKNNRDSAGNIGSRVHGMIQSYIESGVEPRSLSLGYSKQELDCFDQFINWEKEFKPEWLETETVVGSKQYLYAGTLDAVAVIDKAPVLIDFKTSKGIWESYHIQNAAYQFALEEMGYKDIKQRYILRLDKNGGKFEFKLASKPYAMDRDTFLSCLNLYNKLSVYEGFLK